MKWYIIAHFWWFHYGQVEPTMRIEHYGPYDSALVCDNQLRILENSGRIFISAPFCVNRPEAD